MDTKAQKINTHIENIILKNKLLNKGLITVKIKNLKIGKHTSLFLRNTAEMFSFSNIPEIDLSEWYAPNILKMSEMFSCCSALKINMINMGFGGFNRVKECDMLFYNFKGQINSSDKEFMRKFSR